MYRHSETTPAGGKRREDGQALVELALVTPILVLLIMAIFQFAFVLQTQMGLTNAVREAARRAAAAEDLNCGWIVDQLTGSGGNPGLLAENVQGYSASRASIAAPVYDTYDVGGVDNYRVIVSVTYSHPEFFPIAQIAALAAGHPAGGAWNWEWTASAEMRLEQGDPGATWGGCP